MTAPKGSTAWLPEQLMYEEWLPNYEVGGYRGEQRYHLEVWVEKSTMEDVLWPICSSTGANLMHASGELSATQVYEAAKRIAACGRSARIFYISDYDPAGQRMPVSAGRKLEWLMRSPHSSLYTDFLEYLHGGDGHDVTLTPLALTEAQIAAYDLPRRPLKAQKGRSQWEKQRGAGGVELDALEALHPGALARIVHKALRDYRDLTLATRVEEAREEATAELVGRREEIIERHRPAMEARQREYMALCAEISPRLDALCDATDQEAEAMQQEMEAVAEELDLATDFPVPEAAEAEGDDPDEALLYSERYYCDQLAVYHKHQRRGGGGGGGGEDEDENDEADWGAA